jgi:hypothetical protein
VRRFALKTDPMATDPARWGHSLGNLGELVLPCLDATAPRALIEVGAYAGDVTRLLADWAGEEEAVRIWSVDPEPQASLVALAAERAQVELVRKRSLDAIPELPPADTVIIDGDHNYYTVSQELALIEQRAANGQLPLVMCHDVCWPHGRRDSYYAPDTIPAEHRQPMADGGHIFPGVAGINEGGLPFRWPAEREGGARNGVLTALEDFLEGRDDLRFAFVPAFFGLGVIWSLGAPYASELEEILEPWDRNPILERMEWNRVLHLSRSYLERSRASACHERGLRKDAFLNKLLESKSFTVAVWVSRLRQGGAPAFSKEEVRAALDG